MPAKELERALIELQKNNRICPRPDKWQQLYEMLPNKICKGSGWEPSLPLILAAWWETPDLLKIIRFREHIEWADSQGCLKQVVSFLQELPEDQWHHFED